MKQRIVTGVLAAAGFIAFALAGGWFFAGLLVLMAIIGFSEYVRMNGFAWHHPASLIGFAGMLTFVLPWSLWDMEAPSALMVMWIAAFLLLAVTVVSKNKTTIDGAALMLLGALYVGYGFGALDTVRQMEEHGLFWTFLVLGCIIASDVGAYFAGRALGKHKLWPSISPNKTIEGAAGGVILSLITAVAFALAMPDVVSLPRALGIGLIAAVAGQLGDLIQSAYKRVRDIKDTGAILPGHGGILDRCDSWIIVFPLVLLSGLLPT
ncbi:phosphatidate cytidylyltransferase [Paenibacillus radicis (ex Gao et al. 2016)]|uniref:Phosphatidate cytidylyltransferase n=1 Tax=Paenibacillus radicis (ex Gao et al. 2016) TaxID=1737354 RepID=A0A917M5L6_9BACL|nr:phosphatidate cytidylyltransferase [Paenibacillus radicis (ex Gao et al. 2016)]GGG80529.1 phosphatidate cytidylyltransferase [Paenibacillus radicis (ex Gao et al. 2016)]